eukprot:scaffold43634_cov64-Phaeocystis_antarctica.AAC.14
MPLATPFTITRSSPYEGWRSTISGCKTQLNRSSRSRSVVVSRTLASRRGHCAVCCWGRATAPPSPALGVLHGRDPLRDPRVGNGTDQCRCRRRLRPWPTGGYPRHQRAQNTEPLDTRELAREVWREPAAQVAASVWAAIAARAVAEER